MRSRSTALRSAVLGLVAASAGFATFEMSRHRDHEPPALPPPAAGAPAAGAAAAESRDPPHPLPRPIPEQLPDFTLPDRDGVPRQLSHWRDQPLMVNFWATWCAPCRREIPLLKALRRERVADHLEVVGIAVDNRTAVLEFAARLGIDYPLLIGEDGGMEAADSLGMDTVFPFTLFADRRHRIVAAKVGELHADEAGFILDRVHDIDAGHLDLPAARTAIADKLRELAVARAQHPEN
jgi:thiol-disulfide isomerase/thioredoxin